MDNENRADFAVLSPAEIDSQVRDRRRCMPVVCDEYIRLHHFSEIGCGPGKSGEAQGIVAEPAGFITIQAISIVKRRDLQKHDVHARKERSFREHTLDVPARGRNAYIAETPQTRQRFMLQCRTITGNQTGNLVTPGPKRPGQTTDSFTEST